MRLTTVVLAAFAVACAKKDSGGPFDSARVASAEPIDSGTYTTADFRSLRWIEGRWRGFMQDGNKFYESYRFLDDSTIVKNEYPDSTFGRASGESRIMLRRGVISDEGERSRYVATRLDSAGIDFAPQGGTARNYFTWAREDSTKWNATLRWKDAEGRPQTVMYALHRFGR
jgi:hypothetical protein